MSGRKTRRIARYGVARTSQTFVMPVFMRGGTNVLLPGFDLDLLLDTIEREGVTATAVVPTIVYMLLDHPRRGKVDLSALRTIIYAGSPMAPDGLRRRKRSGPSSPRPTPAPNPAT